MEEILIAPCGMNCALCAAYLSMKNDLRRMGVMKTYCAGCRPRGKNCAFMKKNCELIGEGKIQFCYMCADFPCRRLNALDKRYRTKYHMSMIENLENIKKQGIRKFIENEKVRWTCTRCGGTVCVHKGYCYSCGKRK